MEVKSTRLRYVSANSAEVLSLAISSLPFKVEIKGNPVRSDDGQWYCWFIIPDVVPEFANATLGAIGQ